MKKIKNYLLLIFGTFSIGYAQDVIKLNNGEEIKSKVLEVGVSEIQYKKTDPADTTLLKLNKSDIESIKYKSGRVDVFNKPKPNSDIMTLSTGEEVKVKVIEVGTTEIQYKKINSQDTLINKINKSEVLSIKYKSGRKDVFNESKPATDIIFLKSGEEIKAKVLMVGIKDIEYKKLTGWDTSITFMKKSDINMIKYKSGRVDYFNEPEESKNSTLTFQDGIKDGQVKYPAKNTGAGAALAFGFIPAIICASTPPKVQNLGVTDKELLSNSAYMTGYRESAHKIKKKKVWTAFGIRCGILLGMTLLPVYLLR